MNAVLRRARRRAVQAVVRHGPSGRTVHTQWLSRTDPVLTIDVSALPAGIWMVQIRDEDGRKVVRKVAVVK